MEDMVMQWHEMPRPIIALAPMDGITDTAYRQTVRLCNKEVVLFSEFTSADGFLRSERVRSRLYFQPEERPYFVQLFGNNPTAFREAALALEQKGVCGVDINMGCPSKKIVNSQHGSELMRNVDAACRIVEAVANACQIEVSVKTRLGWEDSNNLNTFASALCNAGLSLITIHGRTYKQGFSGVADWEPIYRLKETLSIPVLGNGDVLHNQDGHHKQGNLDGFMIGRAAIGNPWVFQHGGKLPSASEQIALIKHHYQLLATTRAERRAVLEFRKHLAGYLRSMKVAKACRNELLQEVCAQSLLAGLEQLASPHNDLQHVA